MPSASLSMSTVCFSTLLLQVKQNVFNKNYGAEKKHNDLRIIFKWPHNIFIPLIRTLVTTKVKLYFKPFLEACLQSALRCYCPSSFASPWWEASTAKKKVLKLESNGSGLDCGIWYPTALTPISPYRKDADSLLYYVKEGMLKMMSRHLTWHRNTPFPTSKKPPGSSFPWGLNLLMAVMLVFPQDPFFFF